MKCEHSLLGELTLPSPNDRLAGEVADLPHNTTQVHAWIRALPRGYPKPLGRLGRSRFEAAGGKGEGDFGDRVVLELASGTWVHIAESPPATFGWAELVLLFRNLSLLGEPSSAPHFARRRDVERQLTMRRRYPPAELHL